MQRGEDKREESYGIICWQVPDDASSVCGLAVILERSQGDIKHQTRVLTYGLDPGHVHFELVNCKQS